MACRRWLRMTLLVPDQQREEEDPDGEEEEGEEAEEEEDEVDHFSYLVCIFLTPDEPQFLW